MMISISFASLLIYATNDCVKLNSKFKIPDNIDKIVIGHSHSECAFNDTIIGDLKNFSTSGESYFYNYYKTVELLNQNKNINTVFIEFSNNQISKRMDAWIWEEPYLSKGYKLYGPFLSIQSKILLAKKNPFDFFNSITIQLSNNLESIYAKDYDYAKKIGGYTGLKKSKIDSLLSNTNPEVTSGQMQQKISEINMSYLKKIIERCKSEKVKVYLVRSPFHKKYPAYANEDLFQSILKSEFSELEFLDFKDFPLKNSEYADFEHLNYLGAKKFSVFFNSLLNNGLLDAESKADFIKKAMYDIEVE